MHSGQDGKIERCICSCYCRLHVPPWLYIHILLKNSHQRLEKDVAVGVDTLWKKHKDVVRRAANSADAAEALKTSLLHLSVTPKHVLNNAEGVYRRTAIEPVTQASVDLRQDIAKVANVLTVWNTTVNADFDGLWTSAIRAKEAAEEAKKIKLATKRKQRKQQRKGAKGTEGQGNVITSTSRDGGVGAAQDASGGVPEAGDPTPEDDADEDIGKDWRTCTVTLKQVLREELIGEGDDDDDDYHRILTLLNKNQAYASNLADAIFAMVHKETILVSC